MSSTTQAVSSVHFHDHAIPAPVPVHVKSFGVVSFTFDKMPITQQPIYIVLSIDQSASMNMTSQDGTTRMSIVKLTACNILRWIADNHTKHGTTVLVRIVGFDDRINYITIRY